MITIYNLNDTKFEVKDLDYGTSYFWRVKSLRSTDSSDWSTTFHFSTLISPVVLQSPINNASEIRVDALLKWETKDPGIAYVLQITPDSLFKYIEIDEKNIPVNYFQIEELKPNTIYYWRIKAVENDKMSDWSAFWNFKTNSGLNLSEPKLLLPKDNSEASSNVNIQWKKVVNAQKYVLQLSTNNIFTNVIQNIDSISEPNITVNNLVEGNTYFWRVKGFSKYDSSKWSMVRQFNVVKIKKIVQLLYPNNDDLQMPLSGYLEWNSIESADFYEIQLADNDNFNNPILNIGNHNQVKIAYSHLIANKYYFWRVRYSNSETLSEWSEIRSFKTKSNTYLDAPNIISHQDGSMGFPIVGKIIWNEIANATEYQISISKTSNFSNIVFRKSDIKETEFSYPELEYSTTYFIRISAYNDNAQSTWSTPIMITTELESPKIDKSLDGLSNVPSTGRIKWVANENDHWYRILISKSESFDNLVVDNSNFENNYYNFSLENNTTYYCKVKTYNDSNFSNWSETIRFTTEKLTSVNNLSDYPEMKIFPNPANEYFQIDFNNIYYQSIKITVYDNQGNLVKETNNNITDKINIKELHSGSYFININLDNNIYNLPLKIVR